MINEIFIAHGILWKKRPSRVIFFSRNEKQDSSSLFNQPLSDDGDDLGLKQNSSFFLSQSLPSCPSCFLSRLPECCQSISSGLFPLLHVPSTCQYMALDGNLLSSILVTRTNHFSLCFFVASLFVWLHFVTCLFLSWYKIRKRRTRQHNLQSIGLPLFNEKWIIHVEEVCNLQDAPYALWRTRSRLTHTKVTLIARIKRCARDLSRGIQWR